jgi:hypothetical protein
VNKLVSVKEWLNVEDCYAKDIANEPLLIYSKDFINNYHPTGVIEGFYYPHTDTFIGSFWDEESWVCKKCEPTHLMYFPEPPEEE